MSELRTAGAASPGNAVCFTFSTHHNAWALARGLERLGLRLEAVSDESGLLSRSRRQPAPGDVLFFTDERSLLAYARQAEHYRFHPRTFEWRLADDKLAWARVVCELGEHPVPFWEVTQTDDEGQPPEWPIYLKGRHSWQGARRMPRGYVCETPADLARAFARLRTEGCTSTDFFWQRLIRGPISNNFSVCGFYDCEHPQRSTSIVVQKLLGDGPTVMSCGAVVETVRDPANLLGRTAALLGRLRYTGPFELEFLRDGDSDRFYVLELNPRFWMQHGLFVEGFGNAVIARYLELDTPGAADVAGFRSVAWVNAVDLMRRLPLLLVSDAPRRRVYLDLCRRALRRQTRIVWSPGAMRAVGIVASQRAREMVDRTRAWFANRP